MINELEEVGIMLAREDLSEGSKLALLTGEYHRVYQDREKMIERIPSPYYAVLVPYDKIVAIAKEKHDNNNEVESTEDNKPIQDKENQ